MHDEIRCVALDMDRTALRSDGRLSDATTAAIQSLIKKGIHVVIASGRSYHSLPSDIMEIPGIEYAITGNGAAVYRMAEPDAGEKFRSGKCIKRFLLVPDAVRHILDLVEYEPNLTFEAFIEGHAYADREYIENPVKFGASPQAVEYVKRTRQHIGGIKSFIMDHIHELDSIDIIVRDEFHKKKLHEMITAEEKRVYVTSSVKQLLEISDCHAGKHSGLTYVLDCLGLQPEQAAAFGDADNDIDMIRFAGAGIAMENASESLKAQADFITKTNDEDGVVCALKDILHLL
ncbi:MAG: Cof-type HAD-IIB family hydrolase [Lachnospiraceae bacterium]|nr:Cof-type HAD-IIB family hydrolase [Lachnospiraceae bacterium]